MILAGAERFIVEFVRVKDDRFLGPLTIAQVTLALAPISPTTAHLCDVDRNGRIDILDALLLAQVSAGLPVILDCPTTGSSCRITSHAPGDIVSGDVILEFEGVRRSECRGSTP